MRSRWMKTSPATFQGFWLTLSLVTCLFLLQIQPISNRNFTLGLLIPFSECSAVGNWYHCGNWYASAITVALRKINSDPNLLAGHHLNFIWNDTRCKEHVAVKQQIYQLNAGVDVFIGPACHCKTAAINAAAFNKAIISYGCSSAMVENERLAPTFIRSRGIDEYLIPAIARVLTTFKWKHIAIIFEETAKYIKIKDLLVSELERDGFPTPHIVGIKQYESFSDDSFVVKTFSDIKEHAKILVFVTEISISRPVVYYLRHSGLVYKDTVFIICQVDPVFVSSYLKNPLFLFLDYPLEAQGTMSDNKTRLLKKYLNSVLMIGVRPPTGKEYYRFQEQVKADISKPPFSSQIYKGSYSPKPPFLAASLYDAVMLYALALNKTLAVGQKLTGVNLANKLKGTNFKSIQGFDMRVNQKGSALSNWTLYQIRDVEYNSGWFAPVGRFLVEPIANNSFHSKIALKLDPLKEIKWANGRKGMNEIPKDMPKCGFKGKLCKTKPAKDDQRIYIIAGVTSFVILVIVILLGTIIRQCKRERELKSKLWKIRHSDLQ